jgi:hypothetical protein
LPSEWQRVEDRARGALIGELGVKDRSASGAENPFDTVLSKWELDALKPALAPTIGNQIEQYDTSSPEPQRAKEDRCRSANCAIAKEACEIPCVTVLSPQRPRLGDSRKSCCRLVQPSWIHRHSRFF